MMYLYVEFQEEKVYYEVNLEGYTERQIIEKNDGTVEISCVHDCLAEGNFIKIIGELLEDEINAGNEEVQNVEDVLKMYNSGFMYKTQFNEKWEKYSKQYRDNYENLKSEINTGDIIEGKIVAFYPQGALIEDGENLYLHKGVSNKSVNNKVTGKVVDFDEVNMWVVVK